MVRRLFAITLSCLLAPLAQAQGGQEFQALAYHDIRDAVRNGVDEASTLSTRTLIDQLNWIKANDFNPVSIDQIMAARDGGDPLPDNAILLTFDDGYESLYTHVLPLLRVFNYPAVANIVTTWVGKSGADLPETGLAADIEFLSWTQIAELQASGLVEIGSHSHDLHRGVRANPQGNVQPAAVTRQYNEGIYETDEQFERRIREDLATSVAQIESQISHRPRVLAWPFGAMNEIGREIASELQISVHLGLTDGHNNVANLSAVRRYHQIDNPDIGRLSYQLLFEPVVPTVRAAQIDLDYVYDADFQQQERNLGALLERVVALGINHVFLQAFADPDADGGAQSLYFPNRHLPMRADLFNRAAWQLRTRAGVRVYAWMPILSFEAEGIDPALRVSRQLADGIEVDAASEPRLSPFSDEGRRIIRELYEDLSASVQIAGVLFHDDGRLSEIEDANPAAMAAYREHFGPGFTIAAAHNDSEMGREWARFKTDAIVDLTNELKSAVRRYNPDAMFIRNAFATTLLNENSEQYLAQDFSVFLHNYEYVALMAMPYLEKARNPDAFYRRLVRRLEIIPQAFDRTIFELQSIDWRRNKPIPAEELRDTMRWLQSAGVRHLGYYPDDFIGGQPVLDEIRSGISLASFPTGIPR